MTLGDIVWHCMYDIEASFTSVKLWTLKGNFPLICEHYKHFRKKDWLKEKYRCFEKKTDLDGFWQVVKRSENYGSVAWS